MGLGLDDRDLNAPLGQRRGDFHVDEAGTDDDRSLPAARLCRDSGGVVEGTEVVDPR
jgi:hypothetical protein